MISTLLIGVGTTLAIIGITAKVVAAAPKKANKAEKGEIMKQLLALSEPENKSSGTASAIGLRPNSNQGKLPGTGPQKTTARIPQPIRTQ